jgi:hypothetical protein
MVVAAPAARGEIMDLKVLASGNTFYEINSQIGALLVDAGICSQVEKPKPVPKPMPKEWGVGQHTLSGVWFIKHVVGQSTTFYDGPADAEKIRRAMPGIPDDTVAEFLNVRQFKPTVPSSIWGDQGA